MSGRNRRPAPGRSARRAEEGACACRGRTRCSAPSSGRSSSSASSVLIVWYLIGNTNRNLAARHIATGFAFLSRVAGIPIGESPIPYNPAVDTYGTALIIGILNTLKVAAVGIVLATILGTLIGIGRLSQQLAAREADRVLCRDAARHPAAAATVVLVLDPAGTAPPRQAWHIGERCVPVQLVVPSCAELVWAACAFLGSSPPSSCGVIGTICLEPRRASPAGSDRAATRACGRSRCAAA